MKMSYETREVWRKLFAKLANDWLSIREASMLYEGREGEKAKDYGLNRAVQTLFRDLKDRQLLDEQTVEKKKQSTSKKGKPRMYTSKCPRYRLNIIKLVEDQLCKASVQLTTDEIKVLEKILGDSTIETILRKGNRSLDDLLTKLVFIFIIVRRLHPVYRKTEIPEFTIPEVPLLETLLAQYTEKEIEDFQLAVQRIAQGERSVVNLADKILEASIPITVTSKEYYWLVTGGVVQPYVNAVARIFRELALKFPYLKPTFQRTIIRHFANIKKERPKA
jgi:hypothetical protein